MQGEWTLEQCAWIAGSLVVRMLWQGALIGVVSALALAWLRSRGPGQRYAVGCVALWAFALLLPVNILSAPTPPAPPSTATELSVPARYSQYHTSTIDSPGTAALSPTMPPTSTAPVPQAAARAPRPRPIVAAWYEAALPWLGGFWATGVLFFALHDILGLLTVARMRRRGEAAPAELLQLATRVRQRVGIHVAVPLRVVEGISTAMVTGLFRVVILVPAAMVSGMTPEAVEAILAHEFAHLRRWDRWVNLLQCVLETVLFFHPALWWLSRRLRVERELCCDELALSVCPDRGLYVRALLQMAEAPVYLPTAVLSSHGGSFAYRVRHILGLPRPTTTARRQAGLASVVALGTVVVASVLWSRVGSAKERGKEIQFSDLRAIGMVQARWEDDPRPTVDPWLTEYNTGWTVLEEAKGLVTIPEGAQVKLSVAKTDLSGLRQLPPDAIYYLDGRYRDFSDSEIAPIGHLTGLRALDLGENLYNLHGPGLLALGGLKQLEWLNIHGSPMETYPEGALRQFTGLRYLAGIFRQHSAQALRDACTLPRLEFLSFKGGGALTTDDLDHLRNLPRLKGLALYAFGLSDDSMGILSALPQLEYLNVSENAITDETADVIAGISTLRHLDLGRTRITDAGVATLARLPRLQTLNLANTETTSASLHVLERFPALFSVNLLDCDVPPASAESLNGRLIAKAGTSGTVQQSSNPHAPRVGILVSHFTRTGPVRPDYPYGRYTYGNQDTVALARAFNEANFDVYALLEPGTASLGDLPLVLREAELDQKVIDASDPGALAGLDAVFSCSAHNMRPEVLSALADAVEDGLGLVSVGPLGTNLPGPQHPDVIRLTGVSDLAIQDVGCQDFALEVARSHTLLGNTGGVPRAYARMQYAETSATGPVDGTTLLRGSQSFFQEMPVSYVREQGAGRIVRAQWQHPMQPGLPLPGYTFYVRSLNWVAHEELDVVW